jgi:hypothetical protein
MANDPALDAMLADLATAMPESADSVTLVSGTESCGALFDDGELIGTDTMGQFAQEIQTVVRYRDGAITRPVKDGTVTVRYPSAKDADDTDYRVREARRDPDNPGMIRVLLAPT